MKKPYRLGLDVGSNSIGWCVLDLARPKETQSDSSKLEPCAIRAMGVRIFPDGREPQSEASLAVDRREARGQRRRRDRSLRRKKRLMRTLIHHGLMPTDIDDRKQLEIKDPYALRARGIAEKLDPYEFGRALFHLCQRRGFKSNRKTDAKEKDDEQATKAGIKQLRERMEDKGFLTLGAFLHNQREKGISVRFRPRPSEKNKNQNAWDFYPNRAMYEEEFKKLWEKQRIYHPQLLHEDAREKIHHHIFYQLDLKPVPRGHCTLEPGEKRAPKALPLYQEFRIRQEIANLRIQYANGHASKPLTPEQQKKIFAKLQRQKRMKFDVIRTQLGLEKEDWFNLQSKKRPHLFGDQIGTQLANKKCFGKAWWNFPPEKQNEIVSKLLEEENEGVILRIAREEWKLNEEAAKAVTDPKLLTKPPQFLKGFGRLSEKALEKIVSHMREGKNYTDAAKAAGYDHFQPGSKEILDKLPHYSIPLKRHTLPPDDRFPNPTVHIGLNQLRQLVNELIRRYGHPKEVVIELARQLKQSKEEREKIEKEQYENQKKNEKHRKSLEELGKDDQSDGLLRMRLYEELAEKEAHNHRCVYCGRSIGMNQLFESGIEIEHILPFSRTLDNSISNKTLSCRNCNRFKGNQSPYEAFHANREEWDAILRRAENLPKNKRWRFAEDAMERYKNGGFLKRQLEETRHLSVAAKEYLGKICKEPEKNVYAIPGRLTAILRREWKLNEFLSSGNFKNRDDHRHHAIDAFVVAVTSRRLLQQIADEANAQTERKRLVPKKPYPRFDRVDMKRRLERIIISHRPDHGTNGKLFKEFAYGLIKNPAERLHSDLVYRKPIKNLSADDIKRQRIRDSKLRREIEERVNLYQNEKDGLKRALREILEEKGIRRIRLFPRVQHPMHLISHGTQKRFQKIYLDAGNHHIDILDIEEKWTGVGVSMLEACCTPNIELWREKYPNARLIMRVHKNDLLCLQNKESEEKIYVVKQLQADRLVLSEQNESGNLQKRDGDENDPFHYLQVAFSQLKKRKCRRVSVDFLGRLNDPYPGTDVKYAPAPGRTHRTK